MKNIEDESMQTLATDEYHAHDESITNEKCLERYACPCKVCHGGKMKKQIVIYQHIIRYGHSGISPWVGNNYLDMEGLHNMKDEEAPNKN